MFVRVNTYVLMCHYLSLLSLFLNVSDNATTLGAFPPMTVDEVTKIIRSMPSCESDVILTSLLKSILDKIAGVITSIINISIE